MTAYTPPEFIDNREQRMDEAIVGYLEHLKATRKEPPVIAIATGYFNPEGFLRIMPGFAGCRGIRLLLGAEPTVSLLHTRRQPGDPRGVDWERGLLKRALGETESAMVEDRDLIPFLPTTDRAVRELLAFLEDAPVEVRRYTGGFLHGKAYLFGDRQGIFAGSSNLTAAGLTRNLELNLGGYQPGQVGKVAEWFEQLWEDAEPYDLAGVYEARFAEHDPYIIYMRVLWERYGDELTAEMSASGRIRLTTFQRDGLDRAQRVLDNYGGVLVADGVGLGKSFIAGEIIRHAIEEDNRRVLLISPAALRDGMWRRFNETHQLGVRNISYEQLAADRQVGEGDGDHLGMRAREYDLIVIDEAQAFRNDDTQRSRALRRLLQGKPRKKLILLSATPVNNSLWDLYTLFRYFLGHDGVFAHLGIPSLREKFKDVSAIDPYDLSPDALFDVIDEITVRRTRHFVKKFYPGERIKLKDGSEVTIRFPKPHVSAVNYELSERLTVFFDEFVEALAPRGDGEPGLTMARYNPTRFHRTRDVAVNEMALVGLIRSGLLKRFESSVFAFRETLRRMLDSHEKFLAALDRGYVALMRDLDEWSLGDSDDELDRILAEGESEPAGEYDVQSLREAIETDRAVLERFHARVADLEHDDDPKLRRLEEELERIVQQAEKESYGDEDFREKRKVILFSYYEDTLNWVEDYLRAALERNPALASYRGRMVSVSGTDGRGGVSREKAVFGFVPVSSEAPPATEDTFDIMLSTDVLAEGMNLQQCRNVINFDLPWNPMRLVQRHGRIDRIGSPHEDVYIRCFFPTQELEALLALEERIRRKLAQAAATIGVESEVVPGGAVSDRVFSETRAEIEALKQEDARLFETSGMDPAALSGEEYRQELRKAMGILEDEIKRLPASAGSGFAGGRRDGIFFCARVGERVFLRFVRRGATMEEYERQGEAFESGDGSCGASAGGVGVSASDEPVVVGDTLTCLKLIHCEELTPRDLDESDHADAYEAWSVARRDILEDWQWFTDPVNLMPKVERLFRRMADHVRRHPADLSQGERDVLIETLEAPWDMRTRRAFGGIFDPESADPDALTTRIRDTVQERGMMPFRVPDPLPIIREDEVRLVCWMVVKR
ncbi:MAG: helicase-related protein [Candidatus Eisenbacteria bacterium]